MVRLWRDRADTTGHQTGFLMRDNMISGRLFAGVLCASGFGLIASAPGAETANPAEVFAGMWARNSFNFEPIPGLPAPLINLKRIADGTGDAGQIVGDYNNPLLKPEAAE